MNYYQTINFRDHWPLEGIDNHKSKVTTLVFINVC